MRHYVVLTSRKVTKFWRNYYLARQFTFFVVQVSKNFGGKLTLATTLFYFVAQGQIARRFIFFVAQVRLNFLKKKKSMVRPFTFSLSFEPTRPLSPSTEKSCRPPPLEHYTAKGPGCYHLQSPALSPPSPSRLPSELGQF